MEKAKLHVHSGKMLLDMYRRMLVIRRFEEKIEELFLHGVITGTAHASAGQEAVSVGACSVLKRDDYVTSNHRGHGHMIAKGGDPGPMMAELFGKSTGYSGGRGGSQLMASFRLGFLGANGITGGGIPIATGVGLSLKLRGNPRIVACFFGDGAANQGTFHESLNMAGIWKLPVVYICENNLYAMSTPFSKACAAANIADRAAAYGFPGETIDGNDVFAVRRCVGAACERARRGDGPTLIECKTYRTFGHSRGDPRRYRTREEEEEWRARDPIERFRETLLGGGHLTAGEDRRLRQRAAATVAEAVKFARRSPDPDPRTLEEGLFA